MTKRQQKKPKVKPSKASKQAPALSHESAVSPNAVDVVGIVPEEVHVDPEITEGHPGYDETGPSELRSPKSNSTEKPDGR